MNNTIIIFGKIISILVFVFSCFWFYNNRDWEPFIAILTSLGVLITLFVVENKTSQNKPISQNQKSGDNSTNYQAGGDITINTNKE